MGEKTKLLSPTYNCHDITEILLKVVLNTITLIHKENILENNNFS
jgi:hypothetical protein